MAKEKQTGLGEDRIYSSLLTVPKDDGNFKSALEHADVGVIKRVLWDLPEEKTASKRKVLEARLKRLDPVAAQEFAEFWAKETQAAAAPPEKTESTETVLEIEVDRIAPSRFEPQARRRASFTDDDLQSLADSIKTRGLRQPILVRPLDDGRGDFEIVFGERRFLATRKAGFDKIRCFVEKLTDAETVELQYEENHQRKQTSPLDDAFVFRFLHERENYSAEQIADRFNKKLSEVEDMLALNGLCAEAARDFDAGRLPLKHAVYLAKFFSMDMQEQICKEALAFHYNERKFGAVSFKMFKEEVEENFVRRLQTAPFDTEDERLHLDGTTVSPKCSICPQRTGANTLFKEISDQDCCLNRECFQFKTNVNLRLQREEIAARQITIAPKPIDEALKDVPLVTDRSYIAQPPPFKEKVKTDVEIYDEPECPHSELALAVEGSRKGNKVWICENTACEVHRPAPPEKTLNDVELQEKEIRFNKLVDNETRHLIMSDAINSFDDYAVFWQYDDLIRRLIFELLKTASYDAQSAIARVLDVSPREFSDDQKLREWIDKLDKRRQSQTLFLLTFRSSGLHPYDETDELAYIADEWASHDYDRFAAEARLQLAPDEFKDIAARHLERLKNGEPSRVPRFWTADALDADELTVE